MEFLDPESPSHDDKMMEREIYLSYWRKFLPPKTRVLDIGGGVGRFTAWLLENDCEVELVDPDLRSIWRAISSAVGKNGRIDAHWATGETMPILPSVDVVLACEVLNYVENPQVIVDRGISMLKEGGMFLMSVEAKYGWAMGPDVHEDTIESFLCDTPVHVKGDRWVRTYSKESITELLSGLKIISIEPTHYAMSGPFENCSLPRSVRETILLENRLRQHPISQVLNRAWTVVAQKV